MSRTIGDDAATSLTNAALRLKLRYFGNVVRMSGDGLEKALMLAMTDGARCRGQEVGGRRQGGNWPHTAGARQGCSGSDKVAEVFLFSCQGRDARTKSRILVLGSQVRLSLGEILNGMPERFPEVP